MTLYLTLKALHLIAVIAWMAGMLYLPRLFVYHVSATGETSATFKIMERRLFKFIMNPALIAVWLFGGLLIWQMPHYLHEGWFHVKLLLVVLMTGLHHYYGRLLRDFRDDKNRHSARFYKIINEIPTVLLVIIVFLVVFKGF
jgi:putative membrane protein